MNIQSTMRVSKVSKESEEAIGTFVTRQHDIAWTDNLGDGATFGGVKESVNLPKPQEFRVLSLEQVEDQKGTGKRSELNKAYLSLGMNATALIGEYFPESMKQPIQGMELIVASYSAFDAWSDKSRSNDVQASLATAKALLEAIDVFAPLFPGLKDIQPYTKIAGVVLKTAESSYLIHTMHQDE